MFHLARWLVRHLNDPASDHLVGAARRSVARSLAWLIEHELDRFARLHGRATSRTGRNPRPRTQRHSWTSDANAVALAAHWAGEIAMARTRSLSLEGSLQARWPDCHAAAGVARVVVAQGDVEKAVSLGRGGRKHRRAHAHSSNWWTGNWCWPPTTCIPPFAILRTSSWRATLPALLDDFQQLLRDALDLLRELGEADDRVAIVRHWDLPSISPHWQNRGFRDWVTLIELLRDAWLAVRESDPVRAHRIALGWFDLPYSTFKRLALFAASQNDCIEPAQWVEWLISDDAWWLWSPDTQRETMRLLVLQGAKALAVSSCHALEAAILGRSAAAHVPR